MNSSIPDLESKLSIYGCYDFTSLDHKRVLEKRHTYGEEKLADIAKLIPHSYDVLCAFLQLKGKKPRLRRPQ